ncbi:MAG TPA: hypothetical protein VK465_13080 [Fibrobacteria bacterium]|nr:hypothetical protein [Fibrobacteria bacterium]
MSTVQLESKTQEKPNHAVEPRSRSILRIAKKACIGALSLAGILSILNFIWVSSGSNKWKLIKDAQGIQIYTLKAPGSSLIRLKAVMTYKGFSLNHFVAAMIDDNHVENCKDWIPGCVGMQQIERFNPATLSDSWMIEMEMPWPLKTREFLYKSHLTQDKESKEIFIELIAAPSKVPTRDGFIRLDRIHNSWRYTPQPNGDIRIEHQQYCGFNGVVPDFLVSMTSVYGTFDFLANYLPGLLNKEKYRKAKFDFILEPEKSAAPKVTGASAAGSLVNAGSP